MTHRTWKHWARRLLPPIVVDWVRPPTAPPSRVTWRGVYPTRRDVPTHRDAYDAELIDEMVKYTHAAYQGRADQIPLWHETFVVAAALIASARSALHIVDYGGGVGSAFAQLLPALPGDVQVRYLVVDMPDVCDAGRQLFNSDDRIRFSTELPQGGQPPDLVYVNAVLQYLDDYGDRLGDLAALKAPWILFSRLSAWDGPRFATQQVNLPGRQFASWFVNVGEVSEALASHGYRPACDCVSEKRHPADLPETHRVDRLRTMLFVRNPG
ncbi:MAG: methyltransferase, TIGR04325 family [Vicinamibacterales bacterium]